MKQKNEDTVINKGKHFFEKTNKADSSLVRLRKKKMLRHKQVILIWVKLKTQMLNRKEKARNTKKFKNI